MAVPRPHLLAAAWLLSRLVVVWLLLAGPEGAVRGDLTYFAQSLESLRRDGIGTTLVEYPVPAVAALLVPWQVARLLGLTHGFDLLVVAMAVLTDGAFLLLLHRAGGPGRVTGSLVWVLAVPLLGATAYARFDLLPGVLVGAALLLLVRRPAVAGACLAVATAVKLWPALLIPTAVAAARRRGPATLGVVGAGLALVAVTVLVSGWSRLLSPLTYQDSRGLQIESLPATPAMLARLAHPERWQVFYSAHHAYEVVGPGTRWLLLVSTVATVALGCVLVAAWVRVWRGPAVSTDGLVWLLLASVTGFVASGKVLSPQYLLWLTPAAAAGLAAARDPGGRLLRWTVLALATTALTQLVFPILYGDLSQPSTAGAAGVLALALRNLMLLLLTLWAWSETWSALRLRRPVTAREPA